VIEQFFAKVFTGQEIAYSMRIGGALLALLTPDPGFYGLPHYRFFQTFTSRGFIVTSAIFVTTVVGSQLTRKSFVCILVGMYIYLVIAFLIDHAISSNCVTVAHKPEAARLAWISCGWKSLTC